MIECELAYIGLNNSHKRFKQQLTAEKIFFYMVHAQKWDMMDTFESRLEAANISTQGDPHACLGLATLEPETGKRQGVLYIPITEAADAINDSDQFFSNVWRKIYVECQRLLETFIVELYTEICLKEPRQMKSDRKVSMADIIDGIMSGNVLEVLAEKMFAVLSHMSLKEVSKEFEGFGLPLIPRMGEDGKAFCTDDIACFERELAFLWAARNVIQHNAGKVNELFLQAYPQSGLSIGSDISINPNVISRTIGIIEIVAYHLNIRAVAKYGIGA